jgi:hypothetical protein
VPWRGFRIIVAIGRTLLHLGYSFFTSSSYEIAPLAPGSFACPACLRAAQSTPQGYGYYPGSTAGAGFGTCPAYIANVFADGRVEYDGQRAVALLGKHTLHLPVATVQEMLAEAQRIGFADLEERYSRNTSDLPSTIITVHPVGQPAKAVLAEEGIPTNLQLYINYLKGKLDPLADTKPTE